MSKSLVEKYEQMLEQDPASTVFVELARAYLDRGDNEKAIVVCTQGCGHHPTSVVGHVLWGKALINTGRAADAMGQFDKAVSIDRENAHAYNLIGEVLLRKGLYRSALPILRKAAQLQPNDGRITQWLDQTRQALAGGPPPVLYDSTTVDTQALPEPPPSAPSAPAPRASSPREAAPAPRASGPRAAAAEAPAPRASGPRAAAAEAPRPSAPDVFAAFAAEQARSDPHAEPTVVIGAYTPEQQTQLLGQEAEKPPPPVNTDELPLIGATVEEQRTTTEIPQQAAPPVEGRVGVTEELPLPPEKKEGGLPEAPDPFASVPSRAGDDSTIRGLTSTFSALEENAGEIPHDPDAVPKSEPSVIPSEELLAPAQGGGLLDDVVSVQSEVPTGDFRAPTGEVGMPSVIAPSGGGGLLDEIPDHLEAPSNLEVPKVELNTQATEAIAKEYERELRAKFEANTRKKTFLQRHGLKLALLITAVVVVGGLGGSFVLTRYKHKGENLESAVGKGLAAISADTREQYQAALESLDHALTMDDSSVEAWAYEGYAHAVLFAEHGGAAADKDAAVAALGKPGVREAHPELATVIEYFTADAAGRAAMQKQVLEAPLEGSPAKPTDMSELLTIGGKLLLADKKYDDALKRLTQATVLNPKNIRAIVALGDYYLEQQDHEKALEVLGAAASISKFNPGRVIGQAHARLELVQETAEALADLEALPANATVPQSLAGEYKLQLGLAQSANGKHDDARITLNDGLAAHKEMAWEFQMGLGDAARFAGQMANAQKAYEEAIKLRPKSEEAKEGLGRVLLARSRERELLDRLKYENDQRRVALLRGIAAWRLNDAKRARAELGHTEVKGKYPAEAVVYLSLVEAAEQPDKALEILEKVEAQTKRHKATVEIAMARVHMQRGSLDKARALLEEAAKDPQDYEANALLGELLLSAGVPPDIAVEPLQRAVGRNGSHAPSRHLLTRVLLALGKLPEAVKNVDAWTADNPTLPDAWRDAALVYLQNGRIKDAETAVNKGVKPGSDDVEGQRIRAQVLFARGDTRGGFAALEFANTRLKAKDAQTFCEIGNAFVRQGVLETAFAAFEAAYKEDPKAACGMAGPFHAHPTTKNKARAELLKLIKGSQNAWERAFLQGTLARVLLEERDYKSARAMADEALQSQPFHPAAHFASAEVALKQKDEARAIEELQKTTELDGAWAEAHLLLADLLAKGTDEQQKKAVDQYSAVEDLSQNEGDVAKAKKAKAALKKKLQ